MPAAGFVRIGPMVNLAGVIRELGHDPEPLFAREGFDLATFADPGNLVPFRTAARLVSRCVTETGCEHLGLLLGERVNPSALGVVGFMLRAAATVGDALADLVENLDLQDRGASSLLTSNDHLASLQYTIDLPDLDQDSIAVVYDLSITVASKIVQTLCGRGWKPEHVYLARPRPAAPHYYLRCFKSPVTFDAAHSAVVFASYWLDQPLSQADALLHQHLREEARQLRGQSANNILDAVKRQLREAVLTDKCTLPDIARALGVHQRTLNRRLEELGTSYRGEVESARFEVAKRFLGNPSVPITQIATLLNYADVSAFSRAFKRWSGLAPTRWRSAQKTRGG